MWPDMVELFHKHILKPQPLPIEGIGVLTLTMRWLGMGLMESAPVVKFR